MGDVVPFRGKRRWTRPEDYGQPPKPPNTGGGGPPRGRKPRLLVGFRPWLLLTALLGLWVLSDSAIYEPPAFLMGAPEPVRGSFTRCGQTPSENCVIDGDTFRLGERRIRIIGIDAPETRQARCPAEAERGEAATAELQRLLNQGPFAITARLDEPVDRYGRELRTVTRRRADGATQSIAADLLASGTVRRYLGDLRRSWCPRTTPGNK